MRTNRYVRIRRVLRVTKDVLAIILLILAIYSRF